MSRFLCLWWPDFPAWAAAHLEPRLSTQPFGIFCGGKAVALSVPVRRAGVRIGWSLSRAKAVLGAQNTVLVARPHHAPTTETAWNDVLAQLYRITPQIEALEPGLLLAQPTDVEKVVPLISRLGAYGGWADDHASAELAARTTSPGKLRRLKANRENSFRQQVSLSIWSESALRIDTLQRLGWFGWKTHGDLLRVSKRQLLAQFGREGQFLNEFVHERRTRSIATYRLPASIEQTFHFLEGANSPNEAQEAINEVSALLWRELGQKHARWLRVQLISKNQLHEGQILLKEVNGHPEVREAHWLRQVQIKANALLEKLWTPTEAVESITLELLDLTLPEPEPLSLFEPHVPRQRMVTVGVELEARFPGRMSQVTAFNPNAYLPEDTFRLAPWAFVEKKEGRR